MNADSAGTLPSCRLSLGFLGRIVAGSVGIRNCPARDRARLPRLVGFQKLSLLGGEFRSRSLPDLFPKGCALAEYDRVAPLFYLHEVAYGGG